MSPQCVHIVVSAVEAWGEADVSVKELEETIADVLAQMCGQGGEAHTLSEMESRCALLRSEIHEVGL